MGNIDFILACQKIIGKEYVLQEKDDLSFYETDYRQRYRGKALAVLLPASTQEVASLVKLCGQFHVPIVPQSGNTGLVLGSVPDLSGRCVVISLKRMNQVLDLDLINNTITVEAGCLLDTVHQKASENNRLFPLTLASSGSCMIGGNLASNAGGTAVLRYGVARDLCLGLEVVLSNGQILNELYGLRKNNTGYDLKHLFIGSEGTLGIITKAVLKLFPLPSFKQSAFIAVSSIQHAQRFLSFAQEKTDTLLTTFELIGEAGLSLVEKHFPPLKRPVNVKAPYFILLSCSDNNEAHLQNVLEETLNQALEKELIIDVAIAQNLKQEQNMFSLRENISAAQAKETKNIKHDIALPINQVSDFILTVTKRLDDIYPGNRLVIFGHLGDGSLHFNVGSPINIPDEKFLQEQPKVNKIVYDCVNDFYGVISAEHGLGALKHIQNAAYKSDIQIDLMRTIKKALDPQNIMNPGKVVV